MTGKPLMLLCPGAKRRHAYRSARLRKRVARRQVFSIGEEAVDGAVDDDDGGGVSAAATDGSAAHNAHGPRRADGTAALAAAANKTTAKNLRILTPQKYEPDCCSPMALSGDKQSARVIVWG